MDTKITIERIRTLWSAHNLQENLFQLQRVISAGSTGGEIIDLIAEYFIRLRKEKSSAYNVAKDDIDYFINSFR